MHILPAEATLLGLKPSPLQLGLELNIPDLGDCNPRLLIEIVQLMSGLTYGDSGSFFLVQTEFREKQYDRALVRYTSRQAKECSPENKECYLFISSVQFSRSVVSDSLQPHESQHARPPIHHQLPEFTQTHVHRVSDTIQPSHPLLTPSPPAFNLAQH